MTDAQAARIRAAIALWNERAGTRLTVAVDRGEPGSRSTSRPPRPLSTASTTRERQVFINTDLAGEALAITIAHEIGHAFGLSHVPAGQYASVMNPNNLFVEPTPEDVGTLAMRWGSPLLQPRRDPPRPLALFTYLRRGTFTWGGRASLRAGTRAQRHQRARAARERTTAPT